MQLDSNQSVTRDAMRTLGEPSPGKRPLARIAVLVPCYNEELSIAKVVGQFRAALPEATVYVYDNNSKDRTVAEAMKAGAVVRFERKQGKGYVIRRMFADIEADLFVLVDGDATYDAPSARAMIMRLLDEQLDMVVGTRIEQEQTAYRYGHRLGNHILTGFVTHVFGASFSDMLSGYRVFSRRFVKSFPALSHGFEIETELTVHALELGLPIAEVATPYYARLQGSQSKLSTYSDGLRILWMIVRLYKSERPLPFFAIISAAFALASIGLGIPVIIGFFETGTVPRLPTAVLATGLMLIAFLSMTCGLILSTVTRGRREAKLLAYLAQGALAT